VQRAVLWCGTTLATKAQLDGLFSVSLLGGGGGVALCCVRLFVWVYTSARYV
jgi:hypothetical protein